MSEPRQNAPGGESLRNAPDDRRRAYRTVMQCGNSLVICVPPEFLSAMGLLPGDRVEEIFDGDWRGFFVRAVRKRELPLIEPVAMEPSRG